MRGKQVHAYSHHTHQPKVGDLVGSVNSRVPKAGRIIGVGARPKGDGNRVWVRWPDGKEQGFYYFWQLYDFESLVREREEEMHLIYEARRKGLEIIVEAAHDTAKTTV